jgi:hypothetical protein
LPSVNKGWTAESLEKGEMGREAKWTEIVAVGDEAFVKKVWEKQIGKMGGKKIFEENRSL